VSEPNKQPGGDSTSGGNPLKRKLPDDGQ
jgi:hypothetical protein